MLGLLKKLFGGKPAEATQPEAAPYKVEAKPVEDLADIAIAQRPSPVVEKATEAAVESIAKPAKKAPAKKAPAKKPAGEKKPRAPRKPKSKA